jgi:hypothetical protein
MTDADTRLRPARLDTLSVVVDDIDETMQNYGVILGVDRWELFDDASRIGELTVDGMPSTGRWRSAVGTCPSGAVTFELIQPLTGLSTAQLFRARHRTGIMALNFDVASPGELAGVEKFFASRSVRVAQRWTVDGEWDCVSFGTSELLGGYLVTYRAPRTEGAPPPAADRHCDVSQSYTRPGPMKALEIPKLHHIGIVVRDVVGAVGRHASVWDIARWNFINWRREPGRLETPFYRGAPVNHEYLTGRAFDFQGFGFELIQPTFGPSHYKDDYLDVVGEGIHHLLIGFPVDEDRWAETVSWLEEDCRVPLVMGSEMRGGSGRFYYLDSREALGGWVIEATFPRPGWPVVGPINDFSIDFREQRAE